MSSHAKRGRGERSLQRLRREAGYSSAADFAEELGMPASTYARYERIPNGPRRGMPLPAAWRIADLLGCTIDVVVGREPREGNGMEGRVRALTEESRRMLDDYLGYLELRDRMSGGR